MTDNESVHALTGAYVLDALEPGELTAFQAHLLVCPDCREEVRSLRAATLRIPAVSAIEPPPELRASVLDAIAGVRPLPPLPEQSDGQPDLGVEESTRVGGPRPVDLAAERERRDAQGRRLARWRAVAAAAVVVALTAVGWGLLRDDDPLSREAVAVPSEGDVALAALLEAPDLEVYASGADSVSQGAVLRSEATVTAAAILQDLPGLQPGQVYQAWTIADEAAVSAGVFDAGDGAATVMLDGDVGAAEVVAVTIEPDGGSDQPTGDIVFQVATATS
jgi:anti-sigma-K factor RskA